MTVVTHYYPTTTTRVHTAPTPRRRHHKLSRRFLRDGRRAAAVRAVIAGLLYHDGWAPTLATAVAACGSNISYVRAAIVLLRHNDRLLIDAVLGGTISILEAARKVQPLVKLRDAYRAAHPNDRIDWARSEGAEKIFTDVLVPAIT
jgi:hypothetical protein